MTISVVLASYNGAEYIREQLDSLLAQTLQPDEIIVSDDGSTDATWDIVMGYKSRFPILFHVYRNETRLGPHANFKHAFHYAHGDLIAPCDQDDIWLPEKLEKSVNALGEGYSFVFCQEVIQYERIGRHEAFRKMPLLKDCVLSNSISGHLIVFRRELLKVFDIAPEITFDWGLTLMAVVLGTGTKTDYVGCIWRRHRGVVTLEYSDGYKKEKRQKSKWSKYFCAVRLLLRGRRSEVIARRMHSVADIIDQTPMVSFEEDSKIRRLAFKVAESMSEQRVASLFRASFAYMLLSGYEDNTHRYSVREKIGAAMYAFCYPAVWWYDYHNHKAL